MSGVVLTIGGKKYSGTFSERMSGEELHPDCFGGLKNLGAMSENELKDAARQFDEDGRLKKEYRRE